MDQPYPLLSCPFCNGPAIRASGGEGDHKYFGTHCRDRVCPGGSMGLFQKTPEAADAAWNTRHGVNVIDALNALPEAFRNGLVQLLNEARCLSPRAVGNQELASSVSAYFLANFQHPGLVDMSYQIANLGKALETMIGASDVAELALMRDILAPMAPKYADAAASLAGINALLDLRSGQVSVQP